MCIPGTVLLRGPPSKEWAQNTAAPSRPATKVHEDNATMVAIFMLEVVIANTSSEQKRGFRAKTRHSSERIPAEAYGQPEQSPSLLSSVILSADLVIR